MRLAMMAVAGAACLTVGCATTPTDVRADVNLVQIRRLESGALTGT